MVLIKSTDLKTPVQEVAKNQQDMIPLAIMESDADHNPDLVVFETGALTKSIGLIVPGRQKHYYSDGNFNLLRLIFHILKQTGPANILMATYSISQDSLEKVRSRINHGEILSIRFLIDNRVKVMSPLPFQMLKEGFTYRCISLHAKVAMIYNDDWKISIVTSQNATDNPKLERGVIFTDDQIFNFDKQQLENAFNRGTD
ncbi:MAG: hypothetical protein D4R64_11740 [Porphyromonadaceae bacterium]|nr:MAG: hypothetical protein D4R64_11740 [Porphyromonadaceae bacterium]